MRKKLLASLTIFCLSLGVCGCNSANNVGDSTSDSGEESGISSELENKDVSLRVWGAEEDAELLETVIGKFKSAHPEANLTITVEAVAESDCRDSVLDDVLNAADVFAFADDQLSNLVASGVLKAIDNSDELKSRNSAASVDAASYNGTMYAYPLTADNGYFMYYNKEYFTESDLQTLDGITAVAAANGKKVTMDFTSGWYMYSFFGNTGMKCGLNSDGISNYCEWNSTTNSIKGVDVAQALMELAQNPGFMCAGDDALKAGAADGSVIAGVSGVWLSNDMKAAWGDNMGAVKLPTYTVAGGQCQMASYAGYKLLGVNSYSSNLEWAHEFANFLSNEENQSLRFEYRGQGPSNTNAAASEAVMNSEPIKALISQSEFSSLQRIGSSYWAPVSQFGQDMVAQTTGSLSVQQYMDELVEKVSATVSD